MRIIRLLARIMVKALKWLCLGAIVIVHYSCRLMLKTVSYTHLTLPTTERV